MFSGIRKFRNLTVLISVAEQTGSCLIPEDRVFHVFHGVTHFHHVKKD